MNGHNFAAHCKKSKKNRINQKLKEMKRFFWVGITCTTLMITGLFSDTYAQIELGRQLEFSQQFRMADRIVRIAEPGQLADTINVWGDVNSPGRYLIPKGTALPEVISYSFGPTGIRDRETTLDWSRLRVEVNVSDYNAENGEETITNFTFRYNEPLPRGMRNFELKNNQVISVEVKRRPSFMDYFSVVATVVSRVAKSI
jgi:hypothetical protein